MLTKKQHNLTETQHNYKKCLAIHHMFAICYSET